MKGRKSRYFGQVGGWAAVLAMVLSLLMSAPAAGQTPSDPPGKSPKKAAAPATLEGLGEKGVAPAAGQGEELKINDAFHRFYVTYQLGPGDELAIRVKGQPDYTVEKAKVSPVGSIYHPLLGEIRAGGLTIEKFKQQVVNELSEYVLDPVVSIELLGAQSAKIGVLGEVRTPKIVLMTGPMTILDAISEAGGFAETGKRSNVTLLRQNVDGTMNTIKVNVGNILEGKAKSSDNLALQAGDTIIVHGSVLMKAMPVINSVMGMTSFLMFVGRGGGR